MKIRIPHLEFSPLRLVTRDAVFHCVLGIHEALVHDETGSHCDACGMRIWYEEVDAERLPRVTT